MKSLYALLLVTTATPLLAQAPAPAPSAADPAAEPPADPVVDEEDLGEDGEAIVVVGRRDERSAAADIPAENTLDARDIRATGATSIAELLEAVAPQTGSARGRGDGGPVLLLNGRRISGFRELRDIPPEAIEKMEILPEEVALKFGYKADQRVVNIILRRRFRSTVARADGSLATEGGYAGGLADVSRLAISRDRRTTVNLHGEVNGRLDEDERDIALDPAESLDERPWRSLVGSRTLGRASTAISRTIFGDVAATFTGEVEHGEGRSGLGFDDGPLLRDSSNDAVRLGLSVNQDRGQWRSTLTGNAEWARSATTSDRASDLTETARSTRTSGDLTGIFAGPLMALPAGKANLSAKLAVATLDLDSSRRGTGPKAVTDLARDSVAGALNLDMPLLRKDSAVGRLGANANVEVEQVSDFGTLATVGAGLNWAPADRLSLIASWTREDGVPTVQQLGDPVLATPDTPIFDFTRGETVRVTALSGGNPALDADSRTVLKLGANWKPFEDKDLRLRADFVHTAIKDPVGSFPGPSAELEAAFPGRFVRDPGGNLVSVDLRPVNFERSRRDTLRWGFDFSKPLKSARPSQSQVEQMRARFRRPEGAPPPGGDAPPPDAPPAGDRPGAGPGEGTGGGGGFGGGRGGFGNRGRLTFSLTHSITLTDEAVLGPGLKLDYLDGAAVNSLGGRPRHQVEAQAGYFNNGLGARLSGNWRSGTRVDSATGGDLDYAPLATLDLRLFANLGERFDLVARHPWLLGTSARFEVTNLLDAKPRVRDSAGDVPFSSQPDRLDAQGRTVTLSIRKLFLPQRFRRPEGRGSGR